MIISFMSDNEDEGKFRFPVRFVVIYDGLILQKKLKTFPWIIKTAWSDRVAESLEVCFWKIAVIKMFKTFPKNCCDLQFELLM